MTKPQRDRLVRLGYELGSAEPVDIPIRHMVVAGQTQEAGKTTTLEALVARSDVRALSFVTKPGERAFSQARRIPPYFREQSDWRFVAALLEAHMGERMKFERNWISRACEGTKTLDQVRLRAYELSSSARSGMNQDQFRMLGVYLDELVPAIAAVEWASRVELRAGINVMDLELLSTALQQLVIKSSLDWVLKRERGVVVVVPEAWQFVPQGRNTPAKLAAQAFIRQGATLGNYLWLDSQDIGGVDKETLRQAPVWLVGVQREANEIRRTLENIPKPIRPKSEDVQQLELGQFIACWGRHARRVYVQPWWVSDENAQKVARGEFSGGPGPAADWFRFPADVGNHGTAARLRPRVHVGDVHVHVAGDADVVERVREFVARGMGAQRAVDQAIARHTKGGDVMNADQEKKLDGLAESVSRLVTAIERRFPLDVGQPGTGSGSKVDRSKGAAAASVPPAVSDAGAPVDGNLETWLRSLPPGALIQLRRVLPEIVVEVDRPVIVAEETTLRGRLALLIHEGLLDKNQTAGTLQQELGRRGWSAPAPNISKEVGELARLGFLVRDNKWIRAVDGARERVEVRQRR